MGNVAIVAVFIVLIASFGISAFSARRRTSYRLQDFLFTGNTPLLALSSCIGSIISMAVSFTALLSAGYLWGWQMIFPMIGGCLTGLYAILKLSRHEGVIAHEERVTRDEYLRGASYLAIFGTRWTMSYYWFSLAGYTVMLITEIVVLRSLVGFLTDLPPFELLLTIGMVVFVCYAYVYVGGFRGVLVTDYFQLLVVFVFVGLWLGTVELRGTMSIPSMTVSHLIFTPATQVLLHIGVFAGSLAWMLASIDQWNRTLGTLGIPDAKRVLKSAGIALPIFAIVPVLAGAAATARTDIPAAVTNGVSLFLVADLLSTSSVTLRFVFAMALTCAGLTTLNTYIMTMQQLYYEASTRVDSTHWLHYLVVNYPLKWKSVRGFVAALTAAAFIVSCYFPEPYVYAFGVLALACCILFLPFVLAALCQMLSNSTKRAISRPAQRLANRLFGHGAVTVAAGTVAWIALMYAARATAGPLTLHLYLIPATAFAAAVFAIAVTAVLPARRSPA